VRIFLVLSLLETAWKDELGRQVLTNSTITAALRTKSMNDAQERGMFVKCDAICSLIAFPTPWYERDISAHSSTAISTPLVRFSDGFMACKQLTLDDCELTTKAL
jgi:hypothetical protein